MNAQISPSNCGVRPLANDNARIIGGSIAKPGDWGWSVSMYRNGIYFCGGILINSQYVLTAAHCFDEASSPLSIFEIYSGLHNRSSMESWVQTSKVARLFVHERYSQEFHNDIALIRLAEPVKFSVQVVPACIDETKEIDVSNKVAWVTGWGARSQFGLSTILKYQVSMKMFDDQFCRNKYRQYPYNSQFMICGGESSANSGACVGDSGGPLVYKNPSDNKWYAIGVVSWGIECGKGTVLARISNYIDWINKKIELN